MKNISLAAPIPFLCCLCVGLLFDTAGIFRMTLLCAAVHELGHLAAYTACFHRLPQLRISVDGIAMKMPVCIAQKAENAVLLSGPAANFVLCGALLAVCMHKASYGLYMLAGVSGCVGIFNLLPIGVLDGNRLLHNFVGVHRQHAGLLRAVPVLCLALVCGLLWWQGQLRLYTVSFLLYVLWKTCAEN